MCGRKKHIKRLISCDYNCRKSSKQCVSMVAADRSFLILNMEILKTEIRKLKKDGRYVVSLTLPSKMSEEKSLTLCNKMELAFKTMGIKNIKAVPNQIQVFEIED